MATATAIREKIRANFLEPRANWHPSTGDPELVKLFAGGWQPTLSGQSVTPDNAMRVSAVFACVRLAQRTMSTLPKMVYQRVGENKKKPVPNHPVTRLLKLRPNPRMTPGRFFTALQGHLELRGNAFAFIEWGKDGWPKALWPWHPDKVKVKSPDGMNVEYWFRTKDAGEQRVKNENVLHVMDFTLDGINGLSTIAYAREAIGLGMSTEEYGARFFSQGMHARGWVKMTPGLSKNARSNIQDAINEWHQGAEKAHGTLILGDGGEYKEVGINPEDMQFLESRQFTPVDICRFFGFHPDMIGAGKETADNKLQQLDIRFRMHGILPRAVCWEEHLAQALIPERDREEFLIGINLDGLERADIKSRNEAHKIAIDGGWKNRNEVRVLENLEPEPGLDEFLEPMNLGPIGVQESPSPTKASEGKGAKRSFEDKRVPKCNLGTSDERLGTSERRNAAAEKRKALREGFRPLFEAVFAKIVKREVRAVRLQLKALRSGMRVGDDRSRYVCGVPQAVPAAEEGVRVQTPERRDAKSDFDAWLEQYYAEFEGAIRADVEPAVNALADAVALQAMNEIGEDDAPDLGDAVANYLDGLASRHASSSKGQLRALLENEAFQEAVEERLEQWLGDDEDHTSRASKASANETTQAEGYFARTALTEMGVTKFVWRNTGTETCPLCKELDGRVVGADEPFARAGDLINPNKPDQDREDDEKVSLKVRHNIFHPPLHQGCDCLLIPEF